MNLARNERFKLLAAYLNGTAIAAIAIGGFSQIAAVGSGTDLRTAVAWLGVSAALHVAAQVFLGKLRE